MPAGSPPEISPLLVTQGFGLGLAPSLAFGENFEWSSYFPFSLDKRHYM